MSHFHAVVWLDHAEAHVQHFTREDAAYYGRVAEALKGAEEILIVGPGNAKAEFVKYLDAHAQDLRKKVVAVETVDHPSDGQVLAYARKHFRAIDRMRGL